MGGRAEAAVPLEDSLSVEVPLDPIPSTRRSPAEEGSGQKAQVQAPRQQVVWYVGLEHSDGGGSGWEMGPQRLTGGSCSRK